MILVGHGSTARLIQREPFSDDLFKMTASRQSVQAKTAAFGRVASAGAWLNR
jgi:hypothetical protein